MYTESCIFLLFQEEHAFIDAINIYLEEFVQFIYFRFDLKEKVVRLKLIFPINRTSHAKTCLETSLQSDQGLHYPLTELLDTTDCVNGEQNPDGTLFMSRMT